MTGRMALAQAVQRLQAAGVENAAREAAWLLGHAAALPVGQVYLRLDAELTPAIAAAYADLVARRCRREPLQYIMGSQEFLGLPLRVTPAVLIPRPETEILVQRSLSALRQAFPASELRVADIGTGSGCIAVALARGDSHSRLWATDLSTAALAVAADNARRLGVADRVRFMAGDLLAPLAPLAAPGGALAAGLHAVLSNPPYVGEGELAGLEPEVRDHEPHLALTPGVDALACFRRLIPAATPWLQPGGLMALEVGVDQATPVSELMRRAGLAVEIWPDQQGIPRVVTGRKAPASRAGDAPAGYESLD